MFFYVHFVCIVYLSCGLLSLPFISFLKTILIFFFYILHLERSLSFILHPDPRAGVKSIVVLVAMYAACRVYV